MKSISELTDYYYKELFPLLQKLETDRTNLKHRVIVAGLILGAIASLIAFTLKSHFEIVIFAYIGIMTILYKSMTKDYTAEFKQGVIKPLIGEIGEKLIYSQDGYLSELIFERSTLFNKADKFSGNDLVRGEVDGVNIEFSDIHAQEKRKNSKGGSELITIFKGLFIVSEFNKNFIGKTVVLPDSAQNSFGNVIGSWLQSKNSSRDELVKMDSVEFEKEFVVYSSDQIEARYILSHSLMEKFIQLKNRSQRRVSISFVGSKIYIAISYDKDLFEPVVFSSLLEHKTAMEYVKTLHLAIGVVKELKLNEKIWSKK